MPRNKWFHFSDVMDLLHVQSADLILFSLLTLEINVFEEVDLNTLTFQQSAHCLKITSKVNIQKTNMTFQTPPRKEAAEQQSLHDTDES